MFLDNIDNPTQLTAAGCSVLDSDLASLLMVELEAGLCDIERHGVYRFGLLNCTLTISLYCFVYR